MSKLPRLRFRSLRSYLNCGKLGPVRFMDTSIDEIMLQIDLSADDDLVINLTWVFVFFVVLPLRQFAELWNVRTLVCARQNFGVVSAVGGTPLGLSVWFGRGPRGKYEVPELPYLPKSFRA